MSNTIDAIIEPPDPEPAHTPLAKKGTVISPRAPQQPPADAGATPQIPPTGQKGIAAETSSADEKLNDQERARLTELEKKIGDGRENEKSSFLDRAEAFFEIRDKKLYRETHKSAEAYFSEKWAYSRAHFNRIAGAGAIIERQKVSPLGDIISLMAGESYFRPIAKLKSEEQDAVIGLVSKWMAWAGSNGISPSWVESAVIVLHPPKGPNVGGTQENPLVAKFESAIDDEIKQLPKGAAKEAWTVLTRLRKKAAALRNPTRTSGIDWTDATWNPLQGCSRASAGCDYCYAAQLVATRLAPVYPGLASEVKKDGKKTFIFNNIIKLLPEQLGDPLRDRTPRRYFVNSMSDLFHDKVLEEFIEAVFDVMMKAYWHQFQVLTKRPKRMAKFTARYFKDKAPPENIWLGTSAENQKALDERLPHLLKVKTAVPWLSCEPLIGPIEFDSLEGIKWVVVGGESGKGARQMEMPWATSIRDACEKSGVAFFFKQWGVHGPDGKKLKKTKKDGLTPPALEGVIHNDYPASRDAGQAATEASNEPPGAAATNQSSPTRADHSTARDSRSETA